MKMLSRHISYKEAVFSPTAVRLSINNTPPPKILKRMKRTARAVFEPLREAFGVPIKINSFYRSKFLNTIIGGSPSSQHVRGEAIDIDDTYSRKFGILNRNFFCWLFHNVNFDQLIWEFGDDFNPAWVHVSFNTRGGKQRREVLRAYRKNGRVVYRRLSKKEVNELCRA